MMREITREMAISHREFRRVLDMAFDGEFRATGVGQDEFVSRDGRITLCLAAETGRRIGSITMTVTVLSLKFSDMTEAAVEEFLARFDRSFQRGGG